MMSRGMTSRGMMSRGRRYNIRHIERGSDYSNPKNRKLSIKLTIVVLQTLSELQSHIHWSLEELSFITQLKAGT